MAITLDGSNGVTTPDLTVDTDTLTVDTTNNRVGIGTSSPSAVLEVAKDADPSIRLNDIANWAVDLHNYGSVGAFAIDNGGTERLRIDSSGRVGIGTTSPSAKLHLQGASASAVNTDFIYRTSGDNTNNYQIVGLYNASGATSGSFPNQSVGFSSEVNGGFGVSGGFVLNTDVNGGPLIFGTSNTERMRIDSSGNLLVGRTANTDNATFCVDQDASGGNIGISTITTNTSTRFHHLFRNGNGQVGAISTSGSATTYATSSDYRLKENVTNITDATARLKQLNPVRFNFIANADITVDGFLAHEVQDIVPEAITGTHNEVDDDGNPIYQGIDQSKLVPLLVKAMQEQQTIIDDLQARITALEAGV